MQQTVVKSMDIVRNLANADAKLVIMVKIVNNVIHIRAVNMAIVNDPGNVIASKFFFFYLKIYLFFFSKSYLFVFLDLDMEGCYVMKVKRFKSNSFTCPIKQFLFFRIELLRKESKNMFEWWQMYVDNQR